MTTKHSSRPVDGRMRTESAVRLRTLEALHLAADLPGQLAYQASVAPEVNVGNEVLEQWEDWYCPDDDGYRSGFTTVELLALQMYDTVVRDVSAATPTDLPPLDELHLSPQWRRLAAAAHEALETLEGAPPVSRDARP